MSEDHTNSTLNSSRISLRSRFWKWTKRLLAAIVLLLLLLACAGATDQAIATWSDTKKFPPPGQMIDVGGYRMHLLCRGKSGPVIIMDMLLGEGSMGWSLIQDDTACFTQTCSFDRPGYGWSDPGSKHRTSDRIVTELHMLLAKSGLPKPYVLAGASFGGANVKLFALRYPRDVGGPHSH